MWHIKFTLYAYQPPVTAEVEEKVEALYQANKAAKQLTAVRVTPLAFCQDTWSHLQPF